MFYDFGDVECGYEGFDFVVGECECEGGVVEGEDGVCVDD